MMTQQYGQPTQQHQMTQMSGQRGHQTSGTLPQQYRVTLDAVAQAIEVCGWCADRCIESADPNMIECIKLCEDVVELGETVMATVPRNSRFTQDILRVFEQAAQMCAQECGRHQAGHCQDCASTLSQTLQATRQLSDQGQQMGAQQMGGQQMGGQQMGGQRTESVGSGQQSWQ